MERTMSDERPMESKTPADDLTKTKKPSDIQLNEEELNKVSGGGDNPVEYLKLKLEDVY